jgi:hypothetical protein
MRATPRAPFGIPVRSGIGDRYAGSTPSSVAMRPIAL